MLAIALLAWSPAARAACRFRCSDDRLCAPGCPKKPPAPLVPAPPKPPSAKSDAALAAEVAQAAYTREGALIHVVELTPASGFGGVARLDPRPGGGLRLLVGFAGTRDLRPGSFDILADTAAADVSRTPDGMAQYRRAVSDLTRSGWKIPAKVGPRARTFMVLALKLHEAEHFLTVAKQKARSDPKARSLGGGEPREIWITGHSLGGLIAEVVGGRQGLRVEAFNAAPGGAALLGGKAPKFDRSVTHHHRLGDLISFESTHVGKICAYAKPARANLTGPHNMSAFRDDLLRGIKPARCSTPRR